MVSLCFKIKEAMKQNSKLDESYQQAVREAADVIKRGGVILYPTDTVWGLGCDATNEEAVPRAKLCSS